MPGYVLWLDSTTTPPTATIAQIPDPLPGSNMPIGACRATQPTANARCIGTLGTNTNDTNLPLHRWTPVL